MMWHQRRSKQRSRTGAVDSLVQQLVKLQQRRNLPAPCIAPTALQQPPSRGLQAAVMNGIIDAQKPALVSMPQSFSAPLTGPAQAICRSGQTADNADMTLSADAHGLLQMHPSRQLPKPDPKAGLPMQRDADSFIVDLQQGMRCRGRGLESQHQLERQHRVCKMDSQNTVAPAGSSHVPTLDHDPTEADAPSADVSLKTWISSVQQARVKVAHAGSLQCCRHQPAPRLHPQTFQLQRPVLLRS